ncbi:hypothetical protein [Azospirillum sp. sgz302134]
MIRLLAVVGLILGMVVGMDRLLASWMGETLRNSSDRFMTVYRDGPPADVVILGNSRADNHFPVADIQRLTCWSALNLGMGGGPTTVADLLWHDYVERHGAPRLLLLEPTSVVDDPNALADVPLLAHYSDRVDQFIHKVDPTMWASNRLFNTLVFNNNQTIRLALSRAQADDRKLSGSMAPALKAQIERMPAEVMEGFPPNWEAMDRIIATARSHGTKVAVVIAPYFPAYIGKVTNFDAFFEELKRRLPADVPVIDARRAVREEDRFVDALHINGEGVQAMLASMEPDLRPLGGCTGDAVAQLGTAGARP